MHAYRTGFTPSQHLREPHAILTLSVICAETAAQADYLAGTVDLFWVLFTSGRMGLLPSPEEATAYPWTPMERAQARARRAMHIIGDQATVRARILELAQQTKADEVMVTTTVHAHAERLRSYELLAEAFDLRGSGG